MKVDPRTGTISMGTQRKELDTKVKRRNLPLATVQANSAVTILLTSGTCFSEDSLISFDNLIPNSCSASYFEVVKKIKTYWLFFNQNLRVEVLALPHAGYVTPGNILVSLKIRRKLKIMLFTYFVVKIK